MKLCVALNLTWFSVVGTRPGWYKFAHNGIARPLMLAQALVKAGHDVDVMTLPGEKDDASGWDFGVVGPEEDPRKFDALISVEGELWTSDWSDRWLDSRNIIHIGSATYHYPVGTLWYRNSDHPTIIQKFRTKPGGYFPFGVARYDMDQIDMPPRISTRLFYSGIVYQQKTLDTLNELATQGYEIWAALLFPSMYTGVDGFNGITQQQRDEILHPNIRLVSDLIGKANIGGERMGQGPGVYGAYTGIVRSCDVGLAFETHNGCSASKIDDYLGNGLPAVVPPCSADARRIAINDFGTVAQSGSSDDLALAIEEEIAKPRDREQLAERAEQLWGFDTIAERITHDLMEII